MYDIMSEDSASTTSESPICTGVQLDKKDGKNTLGILVASVFIVGAMCGSGVLAIPQAIVKSGYIGIPVLIICGVLSAYTGTLLGKCWTILRIRYPEYLNERVTDPYPTIAFRAAGKVGQYATRVCIDVTLFGGATVFLLLVAGNISELMKGLGNIEFSLCYVLLIAFGVLTPLTWLGTPKDFWQAGVMAAVTSTLAAVLIFASLIKDSSHHENPKHSSPSLASFSNAFGTILFSFGGASCFPTIQVDMTDPTKFPRSVTIGIGTVLGVYLLVGVTGFAVLGDGMTANVLNALPSDWISYTVNILITSHLLMAYMIVSNPINQEIEGFLKIPDKFCVKRIIIRTSLAVAVTFMALSIPHFSVILSLIGGSTVALTNFIFPPLYFLLLSRQRTPSSAYGSLPSYVINQDEDNNEPKEDDDAVYVSFQRRVRPIAQKENTWAQVDTPLHIKVLLVEIMLIGIVGGISSTYFSFQSLVNGDSGFTVPCYLNVSVGL